MKLTLEIMKKMGFKQNSCSRPNHKIFFFKNNKEPLTYKNVKVYYDEKHQSIFVDINGRPYPCKSVEQLMEGIFYAGMRAGRKQFIKEYKKLLDIKG